MKNPWEEIALTDYENHMKLDSVMQLQTLNEMMKGQLAAYSVSSVMILGIAGGNGLEYVRKDKIERVYGVDINSPYLHVFDGLEQVHHQMEEHALEQAMLEIDYHMIRSLEHMLPNGKKLVQMDFEG